MTKPLDLEPIKARLRFEPDSITFYGNAVADVSSLIAEVEALRRQVSDLSWAIQDARDGGNYVDFSH